MEGLIFIAVIVYIIYSMGKKSGRKKGVQEGSQRGYAAGRASGAKNVYMNEKGGCLGVLLLLVIITSVLYQFV